MPFHAEDMLWILENGIKEFGIKCIPNEQMIELAYAREENGQCVTGWVDGNIVGCGGIDLMWPGVGEVWLFLSYETDKYPVKSFRVIKRGIDKLIKDNNLTRCQGWCRKDFTKAHTLFRHLRFKPEGIAEKYMPDGTDAILYAKVI
jgi:hypothetical protein